MAHGSTQPLGWEPALEPLLQHLHPSSSPFSLPPLPGFLLPPSPCHEPKLVTAAGKFPTFPGDVPRLWGCSSRNHLGPPRLLLPPCSLVLLESAIVIFIVCGVLERGDARTAAKTSRSEVGTRERTGFLQAMEAWQMDEPRATRPVWAQGHPSCCAHLPKAAAV